MQAGRRTTGSADEGLLCIPSENPEYSSGRVTHPQFGMVTGQSSGIKEGLPSVVHNQVDNEENAAKARDETKMRNRKRSHSFHERMRRQKLKAKMNVIQDLIPHSTKKDMASTLEETINHIKTLQSLIQTMYTGSYYPMLNSTMMTMIPGNFGMQLPFPFLQNDAAGVMSMGMPNMYPLSMCQLGLPNPQLLTSVTTSVFPGVGAESVSKHHLHFNLP